MFECAEGTLIRERVFVAADKQADTGSSPSSFRARREQDAQEGQLYTQLSGLRGARVQAIAVSEIGPGASPPYAQSRSSTV